MSVRRLAGSWIHRRLLVVSKRKLPDIGGPLRRVLAAPELPAVIVRVKECARREYLLAQLLEEAQRGQVNGRGHGVDGIACPCLPPRSADRSSTSAGLQMIVSNLHNLAYNSHILQFGSKDSNCVYFLLSFNGSLRCNVQKSKYFCAGPLKNND